MQIHELNNFTGTLGSGAYLAIDDGTDTGKISSQGLLAATEARIDNIIAGPAPSAEEIVDARLGADGVTYPSLGDAIRDQFTDVKSAFNLFKVSVDISSTITVVEANISSGGVMAPAESGRVAIIPLKKGVFKFAVADRATPCRAGFSDTLYNASSLTLSNITEVDDGTEITSNGEYNYLYVYYRSTSYPSATLTTTYYAITDKRLVIPDVPADAKAAGDRFDDVLNVMLTDISGELTDVAAMITSEGVVQSNVNGTVAILELKNGKYMFNFVGRDSCRAGYSDTLFSSSDLTLNGFTTITDGEIINSNGEYRYIYLYYKGTTYPDAEIYVKATETSDGDTVINQAFRERKLAISSGGVVEVNESALTAEIPLQCGKYTIHINNRDAACRAGFSKSIFIPSTLTLEGFRTISDGDTIVSDGEYNYLYIYFRGPSYPTAEITVNYVKDITSDINPLNNKTVVAIGDSLLYGFGIERNQTWLALLANEYNFTAYNYGVSGNPVAISNEDPNGMCARIDDVLDEHPVYDYFILEGGANDMWQDVPLGEVKYLNPDYHYTAGTKYGESTVPASTYKYLPNLDKETFCGAVNYIIQSVRDTCPTARILVLTNYNRKRGRTNSLGLLDEDYVDAMIECCKFMGVPYIDNYHDIGFNIVDSSMRAWDDTGDQHINASGHAWLKNIYFRKLITI